MENLNGKIVTVFGGSGFIGKYIVSKLAKAGYTVKIVSRSGEDAKDIKMAGFVGQIVSVRADITDPATNFEELVEGSYAVVYSVGILYESGRRQNFGLLHAQLPEKIAQAATKQSVEKFTLISAIVHKDSNSKYARSKINGEKAVEAAFPKAAILKPSVVFGAEDNFFNFFAKMSNFSPFLPLIMGGKNKFQPVYVGDVSEATLVTVETNKSGYFELGGPQIFTFKQILEYVLKCCDRKRFLLNQPAPLAKLTAILTPSSILTLDQVELIKHDNIVAKNAKTLKDLSLEATTVDEIVPEYLARYRNKYKAA